MEEQKNKNKIKHQLFKKGFYCVNCGGSGHSLKNCSDAITSYGVILVSIEIDDQFNEKIKNELANLKCEILGIKKNSDDVTGINIDSYSDIKLFCEFKNYVKFLLIRRKHTLGFLEFIRGRYNIDNVDGIIYLFKQMTPYEINNIKNHSFDELWNEIWGNNKHKKQFNNEYGASKEKFNKLKNKDNGSLPLNFYIENVTPIWEYPEWGFPKGRRNHQESNKDCAIREFKEETGLIDGDFLILDNIEPIEENFIGTNGINYKHVYYLAVPVKHKIPSIEINNHTQTCEIGDINYYNYEEGIKLIRPYHTARLKIMTCIFINIINIMVKISKVV